MLLLNRFSAKLDLVLDYYIDITCHHGPLVATYKHSVQFPSSSVTGKNWIMGKLQLRASELLGFDFLDRPLDLCNYSRQDVSIRAMM